MKLSFSPEDISCLITGNSSWWISTRLKCYWRTDTLTLTFFLQCGLDLFVTICSYCTMDLLVSILSNLHLSNQAGVWWFKPATEPAFNKFLSFSSSPPRSSSAEGSVSLFGRVTLSSCRAPAENWRLRDQSWKVFPIAGHDFGKGAGAIEGRWGWAHGARLWNYLHNCKVKALLSGGQQRALCPGSAFWLKRNTICCHCPPDTHPLSFCLCCWLQQ